MTIAFAGGSQANIVNGSCTVSDPGFAGACIVAICSVDVRIGIVFTPPDGTWQPLYNTDETSVDDQAYAIFVKPNVAGSGSYTLTSNTGNRSGVIALAAYTGVDTTTPVADYAHQVDDTSQAEPWQCTGPSVSPAMANAIRVWIGACDPSTSGTDSWSAPSGFHLDYTAKNSGNAFSPVAFASLLATGTGSQGSAVGSLSRGGSNTAARVGYQLALAPAASSASDVAIFNQRRVMAPLLTM